MQKSYLFENSFLLENDWYEEIVDDNNINKWNVEEVWFADYDWTNHFPSFNNMEFEDIVVQKFKKDWEIDNKLEIIDPLNEEIECLRNQNFVSSPPKEIINSEFEQEKISGSASLNLPQYSNKINESIDKIKFQHLSSKSLSKYEQCNVVEVANKDLSGTKGKFEKESLRSIEESSSDKKSDSEYIYNSDLYL